MKIENVSSACSAGDAVDATLNISAAQEQRMTQGIDIAGGGNEDLDSILRQDMDRLARLVKTCN